MELPGAALAEAQQQLEAGERYRQQLVQAMDRLKATGFAVSGGLFWIEGFHSFFWGGLSCSVFFLFCGLVIFLGVPLFCCSETHSCVRKWESFP